MAGVPLSPPTIETDLACIKCAYNLRTLSSNGTCPECGSPVWQSRLARPDLRAFRRFQRGLFLYAVAVLTCVCTSWFAQSNFPHTTNTADPEIPLMNKLLARSPI